jgi:hypothetical protein
MIGSIVGLLTPTSLYGKEPRLWPSRLQLKTLSG